MNKKSATIVGLLLSILGFLFAQLTITPLSNSLQEPYPSLIGLILVWLLVVLLLVIIKRGERLQLSSIGLRSVTGKEIFLAVILGIILSLTVPLLLPLADQILPSDGGDILEVTASASWWLLLLSTLTAGIAEEFIFRGYMIERISELTKKSWAAVAISLTAFILPHLLSWPLSHVIAVVLPLGLILSLIYLWKRNLVFNMIVHVMINLPMVFMALLPG